MKRLRMLLLFFIIGIFVFATNVFAESKNEVRLNFKGGMIHDGYVEYNKIAKVQLFKGEDLVTNITNDMTIDLNEAEYKFVIEEIEDSSVSGANTPIKLNINNWYYPMTTVVGETKSTFKLESSKFSGTLDVKLVRTITAVNTKVENVYNDITSTGVIDLSGGKEYVIDFSKTDELTEGLKSFADLDKTLYYQVFNGSLLVTNDESVAVLKIVGNRKENKAILTAVNVETKKSEVFKGLHTKYTGSALDYDGIDGGIILETRYDYYTKCTYEFTFQYVNEEFNPKEYKFTLGANQTYVIGKNDKMKFRIDADYNLFENGGKVYIDGVLVEHSNYTSESGSTIITFNKDYVSNLSIGKHILKVVFNNIGEATTNFTITKTNSLIANPETGDNFILYLLTAVLSLGSLLTIGIYRKINN